ncbi:uncharacterized protein H6S33_003912 [Morchella sextelata]|uniref:uncharacterized protein n=1 Tax=Morchella sextelata TaxID=1174677 RepID=UPI001D04D63E|nr:uncharacterized protein H6S33_003912 [Morchella sextelata]KAH0606251.1 hypothetical protein H6S33_003912 [Morchella sextelata]
MRLLGKSVRSTLFIVGGLLAYITAAAETLDSSAITAASIPTEISASVSSSGSIIACAILTGLFWGKVAYPSSSSYGEENAYWSATAILSPTCIFSPTSAVDVSLAVKILALAKVEFAIRGGGHTANAGWANTKKGVLISLSELKTLNAKSGYVEVGAGLHWEEVYEYLDARQLSVVGGRMTGVGVSGYLLGGGISYISNERGFGCDNVKNYQVVLGDGRIVSANAQTNPDLFKALKGGTNNFGIVTRFDLYTYASAGVYAGSLYYLESSFDELFDATAAYAVNNTDIKTHVIPAFVSLPGYSIAAYYVFSSDPVTSPPAALEPFFDIPAFTDTTRITNFTGATEELGAGDVYGMRHYLQALTIVADASLYKDIYAIFKELNSPLTTTITGFQASVAYQPLSASMIAAGAARGGNVLGLDDSQGVLTCLNFNYRWTNTTDDATVKAVAEDVIGQARELAKARGLFNPYIYLNYADPDAEVIEGYGAANVKTLQTAKKKWDPENVFSKLVKGGFKVPM